MNQIKFFKKTIIEVAGRKISQGLSIDDELLELKMIGERKEIERLKNQRMISISMDRYLDEQIRTGKFICINNDIYRVLEVKDILNLYDSVLMRCEKLTHINSMEMILFLYKIWIKNLNHFIKNRRNRLMGMKESRK